MPAQKLLNDTRIKADSSLRIETRIAESEHARTECFVKRWFLNTSAKARFDSRTTNDRIFLMLMRKERNGDLWVGGHPEADIARR